MDKMKELVDKQSELVEQVELERIKLEKTNQELNRISEKISELKEQQDYGSFKFIHSNMPIIIQKIAPKHKVPKDREMIISSGSDVNITASIPWAEDKCSDNDPCNINVCPRCTLLHFKRVLDRLLAEYYTK